MNLKLKRNSQLRLAVVLGVILGTWSLVLGPAFAESTSPNYALNGKFTGGSGGGTSTNYEVSQGSFGMFSGVSGATSANYQIQSGDTNPTTLGTPEITGTTPGEYAWFFDDATADYSVATYEMDGDSLQYQAKQDGAMKDGPQSSENLSWVLSAADRGRHAIEIEVIDPDGTVSKQQHAYVVRRPIK